MRKNTFPVNAALLIEDMKRYERLSALDTEVLYGLLTDMWVFTHGLAVLLVNGNEKVSERYVRDRTQRVGETRTAGNFFIEKEMFQGIKGPF